MVVRGHTEKAAVRRREREGIWVEVMRWEDRKAGQRQVMRH